MAELKTRATDQSVEAFLGGIADEKKRRDCFTLVELMKEATRTQPRMWGSSIVGFGNYHYKYKSGREGDWFLAGFSPRKASLSLYIMAGFKRHDELMKKLGKHKTGSACLYVKSLDDIDLRVLKELVKQSVEFMRSINKRA